MRRLWAHPTKAMLSMVLLSAAMCGLTNVTTVAAAARTTTASFTSRVFASGAHLVHHTPKGKETLGQLNPATGAITQVHLSGPSVAAQGMLFMP
jgi:streptogramin lyase